MFWTMSTRIYVYINLIINIKWYFLLFLTKKLFFCFFQKKKNTLNCSGKERCNFTLIHKPINVAIEQCGIVGVNWTWTRFYKKEKQMTKKNWKKKMIFCNKNKKTFFSSTVICSEHKTFNCSKVKGCSGSLKCLINSKTFFFFRKKIIFFSCHPKQQTKKQTSSLSIGSATVSSSSVVCFLRFAGIDGVTS